MKKTLSILFILLLLVGGVFSYKKGWLKDLPLFASLIEIGNHPEVSTASGLVGHFSMKTNSTTVTDETGTNDGTLGSGTVTTGIIGQAIDFDGDDDYVSVEHGGELSVATAGTISAWIYPRTISGGAKFIVGTHPSSSGDDFGGYQLNIGNNSGQICFRPRATTSTCSSVSAVPANQWTHVVAVVDATSKHIYINGVEDTDSGGAVASMPGATNYDFYIGNGSALTNDFNGKIDEVRVYSTTLSSTEIAELYAQGSRKISTGGINKGLIAHYSLAEEDLVSASVIADLTPNRRDGTITAGASAGFVADQTGEDARAYDFDGANTKINLNSDFIGTGDASVSVWIYLDSTGEGGRGRIVDNGKFVLTMWEAGYPVFYQDGMGSANYSFTQAIQTGQWYHIAATRTSGSNKIYINGVQNGVIGISTTLSAGTTNVIIGNDSAGNNSFDGKISDLRIYNRVLSSAEVATLYRAYHPAGSTGSLEKGLIAHYPLGNTSETAGTDLVRGWNFTNWTNTQNGVSDTADTFHTTAVGPGGLQKTVGIVIGKRYIVKVAGTLTGGGTYTLYAQGANGMGFPSQTGTFDVTHEFTGVTGSALYHYLNWPSASVTITTFELHELQSADITPNDRHGSLYQDSTIYTTDQKGVANGAMDFNGTTDYLNTANDFIGTGSLSASAWIYLDGYGGGNQGTILTDGQLVLKVDSTNQAVFASSGGDAQYSATGSILTGQWYHVVVTRSGTTLTWYVNGVQSGTPGGSTLANGTSLLIGSNSQVDRSFDGKIADVRIYNRILSAEEVKLLYDQKE